MIGISGVARAGKDTLAKYLKSIIEREMKCDVEIVHLADKLKSDLDKLISCNFNFQVFSENDQEKQLMRPILVSYGEAMKKKWGKDVWMKKLHEEIKSRKNKKFFIIADARFDFEIDYIRDEFSGFSVHVSKINNEGVLISKPANDVEKENDPLAQEKCDIIHSWPEYQPDKMEECKAHAQMIWQMAKQQKGDQWKKTYN